MQLYNYSVALRYYVCGFDLHNHTLDEPDVNEKLWPLNRIQAQAQQARTTWSTLPCGQHFKYHDNHLSLMIERSRKQQIQLRTFRRRFLIGQLRTPAKTTTTWPGQTEQKKFVVIMVFVFLLVIPFPFLSNPQVFQFGACDFHSRYLFERERERARKPRERKKEARAVQSGVSHFGGEDRQTT
jgi:hypothetical protein